MVVDWKTLVTAMGFFLQNKHNWQLVSRKKNLTQKWDWCTISKIQRWALYIFFSLLHRCACGHLNWTHSFNKIKQYRTTLSTFRKVVFFYVWNTLGSVIKSTLQLFKTSDFRLQISNIRIQTSDFRIQISEFRLQISDFKY